MAVTLEHANLTVDSIDACVQFLTTAFPEFAIRGRGMVDGRRWVHVGTDDSYIALNESPQKREASGPLNHLGFVVDDVDAVSSRLEAAGYREGFVAPSHPYRKRRYFYDTQDLEWEFLEYLSNDPAERNDYSL